MHLLSGNWAVSRLARIRSRPTRSSYLFSGRGPSCLRMDGGFDFPAWVDPVVAIAGSIPARGLRVMGVSTTPLAIVGH
jgi:hypothetical protein